MDTWTNHALFVMAVSQATAKTKINPLFTYTAQRTHCHSDKLSFLQQSTRTNHNLMLTINLKRQHLCN